MVLNLLLGLLVSTASADDSSWSVKVLGPNNGLFPILGPKVDVGEKSVQLDPMDRFLSESMRNECVMVRPEDDPSEHKWPKTMVGIQSFSITPSYKEIAPLIPTEDHSELYGYLEENLGVPVDTTLEKELSLSFARLGVVGNWILDIDLYGGGRVFCRMPIQAEDIVMQESRDGLEPIPQKMTVEDRAREALNQFFLVRLMTLPPDQTVASHR
jgi:hypothetical protein